MKVQKNKETKKIVVGYAEKRTLRKVKVILLFAGILSLFWASVHVGRVYSASIIMGYEQDNSQFSYSSETDAVSHNYPPYIYGSTTSGYSDASTQTLRAYAKASSHDEDGYQSGDLKFSSIDTEFTNILHVGAGTSGLSDGDAVTLRLSLSLDGLMNVYSQGCPILGICFSTSPDPIYGLASVDASARYQIIDPNRLLTDIEGYVSSEQLIDFGYSGRLQYYAMNWEYINNTYGQWQWWIDAYDPGNDGRYDISRNMGWDLVSNIDYQSDNYSSYYDGNHDGLGTTDVNFNLDTGLRTINFETFVGSDLQLSAWMSILSQAYGLNDTLDASGNFLNTFGTAIDSPYVSGLNLSYDIGNTSAVPEPSTILLAGIGVCGIIAARLKKRSAV